MALGCDDNRILLLIVGVFDYLFGFPDSFLNAVDGCPMNMATFSQARPKAIMPTQLTIQYTTKLAL